MNAFAGLVAFNGRSPAARREARAFVLKLHISKTYLRGRSFYGNKKQSQYLLYAELYAQRICASRRRCYRLATEALRETAMTEMKTPQDGTDAGAAIPLLKPWTTPRVIVSEANVVTMAAANSSFDGVPGNLFS